MNTAGVGGTEFKEIREGDWFALVTSGQNDEELCQFALILISILTKALLERGYSIEQITSEVTAWIAEQSKHNRERITAPTHFWVG